MTLRKHSARRQPAPHGAWPGHYLPGKAERLVGIGFRCWLAGYDTADISCWETGWNHYARELGVSAAKTAVTELACWVRSMREASCRKLAYYPYGCSRFCRDECIAMSMVAASQHSACPAMRACAFALLGSSAIDGVVDSTTSFASALAATGHVLCDRSICDATSLIEGTAGNA
ncbi:MAG: hypothetical protein Kow0032_04770 [Methyloligellaceae bacterium]